MLTPTVIIQIKLNIIIPLGLLMENLNKALIIG